jgi:steroid delta-isomerase-like uncharacterized protein
MSQQNKALARRIFDEMESKGNLSIADETFASDFVNHTPFGENHGPQGAKQFVKMLRSAFPDLHATVEDQVAEGDKVATRFTARGTHKGELNGIPASANTMEISGIVISRFANGKIIEQWGNPDVFGLMRQIGAIPMGEK